MMSIEEKLLLALERISQAHRVLLWEEGKQFGLSPLQLQVLLHLESAETSRCSVSALALEFDVTKPTLSDTVKSLYRKDLVEKLFDPDDQRRYTLQLSASGQNRVQQLHGVMNALRKPVEGLPMEQKEQLYAALVRLIGSLHKSGTLSVQRMCLSCRFFHPGQHGGVCSLLSAALSPDQLRLDCPEHEAAA